MGLWKRTAFRMICAVVAAGLLAGWLVHVLLETVVKPSHPVFVGGPLLVSDRDRLYICVDAAPAASGKTVSPAAVSAAKALLEDWFDHEFPRHPDYAAKGYAALRVQIEEGCPFEPHLAREGAVHPLLGDIGGMADRFLEKPDKYRFAVFIADEPLVREKFAGLAARRTPEQFLCESHECNEVTTSIYVTEREIADGGGRWFFREFADLMGLGQKE